MVYVYVLKDNSNKTEDVIIIQFVKTEQNGMVSNALEYHVSQVLHSQVVVVAVKPQFMLAHLVHSGMAQDVFS
jgi:hypothetical protein